MVLTDFGVAVLPGDRLSGDIQRAGRLTHDDAWVQTFAPYIPDGGVVCDIGAALGDHTASYAQMVGPHGTVHAFEPYVPFYACLQHNMAAWPQVRLSSVALGAATSTGTMVRSDLQPDNLGMTHLVESRVGAVPIQPLDQIAASWERLDFVKIDVEGSEPLVLDGARETLARWYPVLLVEINTWALQQKGFTPDDVYRRLQALGYQWRVCRGAPGLPEVDILCERMTPVVPARGSGDGRIPMRVHLLACPNVQTTASYALDGFCTRTMLFAALLKRLGHEVLLYASEENEAPCDELIACITKAEQAAILGATPYQSAPFDGSHPLWLTFNSRAAAHIRIAKQPHDVIATIGGSAHQLVAEHHPELRFLEYSIGYRGIAASSSRVFQSHAWRHIVHGFTGVDGGRLFDAVIPPWFPVEDFHFVTPEPYVAFVGRLVPQKGLAVACEAAHLAGVKLIVAGHGDAKLVTHGAEYAGCVSTEERNALIAKASAVLMPTQYIEPFGNVAAEAQLCGTPVIATDYGGFVDSVEPGVSGFRCTSLGEFVHAIQRASTLDRTAIRARAHRLYSPESADAAYGAYFRRFNAMHGDGWRSLAPGLEVSTQEQACSISTR